MACRHVGNACMCERERRGQRSLRVGQRRRNVGGGNLCTLEALLPDLDYAAVWEGVRLDDHSCFLRKPAKSHRQLCRLWPAVQQRMCNRALEMSAYSPRTHRLRSGAPTQRTNEAINLPLGACLFPGPFVRCGAVWRSSLELLLCVKSHVGKLLLDLPHRLKVGGTVE